MSFFKWLVKTIHNVDIDSLISENKRLEGENGDKNSQVITLQKDQKVLEERISDNQKELDVVKYSSYYGGWYIQALCLDMGASVSSTKPLWKM